MQIGSLQVVFSLSADASAFECAALFLLLGKLDAALALVTKTAVGKQSEVLGGVPVKGRLAVSFLQYMCQCLWHVYKNALWLRKHLLASHEPKKTSRMFGGSSQG